MLPAGSYVSPPRDALIAKSARWVRAPISGIFSRGVGLGKIVKQDEVIGYVSDPFREDEEPVVSPENGLVISRFNLPLVHQGDALFHVASMKESTSLDAVEILDYEVNPQPLGPDNNWD